MAETTGAWKGAVHVAGVALDRYRHVCAFFHNADDEYEVLLPFIKEGFQTGGRVVEVVDPKKRVEQLERLRQAGIDTKEAQKNGQLEVRDWHEMYLHNGHFDRRKTYASVQEVLEGGRARGFSHTRLIAYLEWALDERVGANEFLELEVRLSGLYQKYCDPVI